MAPFIFYRMAEIVLELRPELRSWTVTLYDGVSFLQNMKAKGIQNLKNVKLTLHFDDFDFGDYKQLLSVWNQHMHAIDVCLMETNLRHIRFANLESLAVNVERPNRDSTKNIINAHSKTLKRLRIYGEQGYGTKVHDYENLPLLECLQIENDPYENALQIMFDKWGQNLSVLHLSNEVDISYMRTEDLKLPKLKQLRIEGLDCVGVLKANAHQIEKLAINAAHDHWIENLDGWLPTALPNVKILKFEYGANNVSLGVVDKLLRASATSVEHLILSHHTDLFHDDETKITTTFSTKMEKLTHLVYDKSFDWIKKFITKHEDTLESITIGVEANVEKSFSLYQQLPSLKELTFIHSEDVQFLSNYSYFRRQVKKYPHAKTRVVKARSDYVFSLQVYKKYGVDKAIW